MKKKKKIDDLRIAEDHKIYVSQVNVWYQQVSNLKSSEKIHPDLAENINLMIVSNFFPLYLHQRDNLINEYHLIIARRAAQELPPEKLNSFIKIESEDDFNSLAEINFFGLHGFSYDFVSYEEFLNEKQSYVNFLLMQK